jgi:two-component system LytT family response regulator
VRALIVDDEPLARSGIVQRLRRFEDIEIVGECGDGASAIGKILELSPDLVFLDVQMPEIDGFQVLQALPRESIPNVIFVTAHEQHALRAFEVHALDYLLKPLEDRRFSEAVQRARQLMASGSKAPAVGRIQQLLDETPDRYAARLAVRKGSLTKIVLVEDIEWVAAADDYVELHSKGAAYLLREAISMLERRLDPAKFIRIHRSRLVQTACIRELRNIENREYVVKLSDGSEHRSSRTYADRLEGWLSSGSRK